MSLLKEQYAPRPDRLAIAFTLLALRGLADRWRTAAPPGSPSLWGGRTQRVLDTTAVHRPGSHTLAAVRRLQFPGCVVMPLLPVRSTWL